MIFKITFPRLFIVFQAFFDGWYYSHPQPWVVKIIIFDVNTLYIRGYSFMLLLMAADSSKVWKKSIWVSNGLDPDQDRRRSLSGAKLFAKVISRWRKLPWVWLIFNSLNARFFTKNVFMKNISGALYQTFKQCYPDQDRHFGRSWSWYKLSEKVISRHTLSEASGGLPCNIKVYYVTLKLELL